MSILIEKAKMHLIELKAVRERGKREEKQVGGGEGDRRRTLRELNFFFQTKHFTMTTGQAVLH